MKTLGICFGASTLQCLILQSKADKQTIALAFRLSHEGNPKQALLDFFNNHSKELATIEKIAVTGRNFCKNIELTSIAEAEALECALKAQYFNQDFPNLVISAGGETQLVYKISSQGNITSVHSGNKCASGTGEFFLQQIGRMNLNAEEASELACSGIPHKIAGRCSVFCKSDCTHALNKGEPKANIIAGLCAMMADKILDIIKDAKRDRVALIGGGSLNKALVKNLRERLPEVVIPKFATMFEAYGAALWAIKHQCQTLPSNLDEIFTQATSAFSLHEPLSNAVDLVTFKQLERVKPQDGDVALLGLDVGSTTTKAVLMHRDKQQIMASAYLRTSGNPVAASKQCYSALREQIGDKKVKIIGLGVTGSGRQIAALHALTDCVINEIIAHATAAAYFDPEVDTIFEIGGQDAKYTYLTQGVPADYAMNEACSAGTGSFLEESAKETMSVPTEMIGDLAVQGKSPPNFSDQCAAFISSDIKRASQEGMSKNDILAGLVYSICMNYLNRVKKPRPVGKKIFIQGGVCYNRAVPTAMAALIKTSIIVPPEPGLMGAFGIALEVKKQQELGLTKVKHIDLDNLIAREAKTIGTFICAGGKEKCDRKCEITKISIDDKIYPFGGTCDRYYNLRLGKAIDTANFDYVALRQQILEEKYLPKTEQEGTQIRKTIGLMRSFLTHAFAPFYATFFSELGFNVAIPKEIDPKGLARIEAAFCLPVEMSHGSFLHLIKQNFDYIFLPHILEIPVANTKNFSKSCVFVQGEPYYLKTTFRQEIAKAKTKILSPILKMNEGFARAESDFIALSKSLGVTKKQARQAFKRALAKQQQFEQELQEQGKKALTYLEQSPETFGIVLVGRPYNAFASEANMGIPHKVASRNFVIIPYDMLPVSHYSVDPKLYWAMGQKIMQAAQIVKAHDNLFAFYITNFSCGPDSFILSYFRNLMGVKPSLTLELDQHTADAGIDTRIEAALDIMRTFRTQLGSPTDICDPTFTAAYIEYGKTPQVVASDGCRYFLKDPKVEIVFPSMGKYSTQALSSIFKGFGINAHALPVPDKNVFLEGRKNTLCKECLPYILTTGSFLSYIKNDKDPNKITLLFMPTGEGPCRLGQYSKGLQENIVKNRFRDVAVFSLTDENGYAGLGKRLLLRGWQSVVIADVINDIKSMLKVAAKDNKAALTALDKIWHDELVTYFIGRNRRNLSSILKKVNAKLNQIPLRKNPEAVPVISLIGEIFVRQEEFSRKNIVEYLEERGFMVKVAPVGEYVYYSNYAIKNKLGKQPRSIAELFKVNLHDRLQKWGETHIKSILAKSGLYKFSMIDVDKTIRHGKHLIDENLLGESVLTVGLALREILHDCCGVISIGPFGCMPSRLSEAILRKEMNLVGKQRTGWQTTNKALQKLDVFPYLALETDGNPYPQMIEANLEAFVLQAKRVHKQLQISN